MIVMSNVDLPEPFGPKSTLVYPAMTLRFTSEEPSFPTSTVEVLDLQHLKAPGGPFNPNQYNLSPRLRVKADIR